MGVSLIAMQCLLAISVLLIGCQNSEAASGIQKHIFGGSEAAWGQFPWFAEIDIVYGENNERGTLCGGSIIGRYWILTAAHCKRGGLPRSIYIGTVNRRGRGGVTITEFDDFILPPYYIPLAQLADKSFSMHDIALIKLSKPLQFTGNIKPIKLPRRSQRHLPGGTIVQAPGFGFADEPGKGPLPKTLRYMEFETRDDSNCDFHYFLCSKFYYDRLFHSGDSGGPFIWRDERGVYRQVAVGVQSRDFRGQGYSNSGPALVNYLDWIGQTTGIYIDA